MRQSKRGYKIKKTYNKYKNKNKKNENENTISTKE